MNNERKAELRAAVKKFGVERAKAFLTDEEFLVLLEEPKGFPVITDADFRAKLSSLSDAILEDRMRMS